MCRIMLLKFIDYLCFECDQKQQQIVADCFRDLSISTRDVRLSLAEFNIAVKLTQPRDSTNIVTVR